MRKYTEKQVKEHAVAVFVRYADELRPLSVKIRNYLLDRVTRQMLWVTEDPVEMSLFSLAEYLLLSNIENKQMLGKPLTKANVIDFTAIKQEICAQGADRF